MTDQTWIMPEEGPETNRIAAIYARVSTPQQREGTSWETQVEACKEAANKKSFVVPEQFIFTEVGSGAVPARPLFLQFNSLIEGGRVQGVFIFDPDRYSREPIVLEILSEICRAGNVELNFIHGTSGTGMDQNLMRHLEGYVAKKERIKTLMRTTAGKARVLASGRPPHGWGVGILVMTMTRKRRRGQSTGLRPPRFVRYFSGLWKGNPFSL